MSDPTDRTPPIEMTSAVQIVLPGVVDPEELQVSQALVPAPGPGQVLIRMEATGVSFAEQQMRRGKYYDQPPFPFVPGYDLVGTVTQVGPDVDAVLIGTRVAALTKTGGWASQVLVDADRLVAVPGWIDPAGLDRVGLDGAGLDPAGLDRGGLDRGGLDRAGLDPAEVETVVVNGITAWQMLHRVAEVRSGQTILVLGANGGVGSTLVQLARHAGVTVIGTASRRHHDAVRALGATPIDYHDDDVPARVRELAPNGVDAVFDHVGGPGLVDSYHLLARGGTLVSYGSASTRDDVGSSQLPLYRLLARLLWWNALPNGRRAHFFNIWAGLWRRQNFWAKVRADLTQVLALLADGTLTAQVAARIPLEQAAAAVRLAESGTVTGKVVLIPAES